jgi:hypothetical protein
MADEKVEVSIDGLSRLQFAAQDFARVEIGRIVGAVIAELRSRPAEDVFGDVYARHFWDEYCWALEEGPFDISFGLDNTDFGTLSGAFEDILRAVILAEVERLPKHAQILLTTLAIEEDSKSDEVEWLGCIWIEGIAKLVTEAVNERASKRNLSLIGPDRADAIGYEIEGAGFVWSVLDRNVAMNLISDHVEAMIDPKADLSPLAEDMVEVFLVIA